MPPPKTQQKPPSLSRLALVETVHFQPEASPLITVDCRVSIPVPGDEQPYARILKLTPEWSPLDLGWLAEYGNKLMISLKNEERQITLSGVQQIIPTNAVEISFRGDGIVDVWVGPQEVFRFRPGHENTIKIRAGGPQVKASITVFPL